MTTLREVLEMYGLTAEDVLDAPLPHTTVEAMREARENRPVHVNVVRVSHGPGDELGTLEIAIYATPARKPVAAGISEEYRDRR